jgi:hypothetical protein
LANDGRYKEIVKLLKQHNIVAQTILKHIPKHLERQNDKNEFLTKN